MATKPIENLTAPEQATFRAEIGVNAENVQALLVDANIEVASIGLEDTSGLTLPVGTLGLDASNNLVVHDNARIGGKRVNGDRRFVGSKTFLSTEIDSVIENPGYQIAAIPITLAESQINSTYTLRGKVWMVHSGATGAACEIGLQEEETNQSFGFSQSFMVGYKKEATVLQCETDLNIAAKNASSVFTFESTALPISEIRRVTEGTSLAAPAALTGFNGAMTPGVQNLYLGIAVAGAVGATTLTIRWDLELVVVQG